MIIRDTTIPKQVPIQLAPGTSIAKKKHPTNWPDVAETIIIEHSIIPSMKPTKEATTKIRMAINEPSTFIILKIFLSSYAAKVGIVEQKSSHKTTDNAFKPDTTNLICRWKV